MRKFLLLVLSLSGLLGFSQIREKGSVEITPLIGYSSANYYSSQAIQNSTIGGLNFGTDLDYFFNNRWSLRSGLLIQEMGTKYNNIYNVVITEKLNYLTIPVNANWHFGSTRKWNLNFGPSLGFLTSAKVELNANSADMKQVCNSFQLGLNYGIGYKIEVSNKFSILLDYQAMAGLTDVAKNSPVTIKNTYGAFNVGGVFKL